MAFELNHTVVPARDKVALALHVIARFGRFAAIYCA